jgi:serine/threonine protein kinase
MSAARRQFHEGFVISGHYQIENLMAIGDTSDLYGCHEMGKEKTLALKVFRNVTPNSKNAAQFGRVISFLQRLRHPGLGRILDFGLIDNSGKLYFVEELIEGADIVSATEGMPTEQILGLIAELAGIIHFLHSTRTLHGKLKPSNIILSALENSSKKLTVVDYGLLPLFSEEEASASENGMLAYTAPEILLGNAADEKSDLYSLGVLIYQLLARRLPFEDDDPGFLAQKHLQGRPDLGDLSELINGTDLIEKLLAKDPSERPSAREVIEVFLALAKDDLSTQKSQRPKHLSSFFLPASFVGRDSELLLLQDASRRTMESARGRTIFVTGEAGIGKTRIMEELRSWAILDDWRIVEGYCGIHEETAYEPYRQILSRSDQSAGKPIFSFGEQSKLTDSRGFDSSLEFASGQYRDRITRELVRRLSGKPTILFLHDFHLADEATIAVLDYLSQRAFRRRK